MRKSAKFLFVMHFKTVILIWYICVVNLYVSSTLCFDLYLIYVDHLMGE
jgi:hypothetical protein